MVKNIQQQQKKKGKASFGASSSVSAVPLARSRKVRNTQPSVSSLSDGRVRVRHREYLRDIAGSVAFAATAFAVNPGLAASFPWLSTLAANFESYLFKKLSFCFETEKSASTSGSLMLAIDFDAADAAPSNKTQLMAYHNAVRCAVWDACRFFGDQADLKKFGVQRYIRSGNLAANLDIKTYDVGNLFVGTQGEADTTAIGELYVEYDVELITPQSNNGLAVAGSASIATTVASRAAPFTGTQVQVGGLPVAASAATLTFSKVGKYWIVWEFVGTVVTAVAPTLTGTATNVGAFIPSQQLSNAAATSGTGSRLVTVTEVDQTVIFDFTASCTTLTSSNVGVATFALS